MYSTNLTVDFAKYTDGLVPTVVQDAITRHVLMVGFMNQAALDKTLETKKVTFFSRSRQSLWTKGETSGNFLHLESIVADCDQDTLLVQATPVGAVCHTGAATCFTNTNTGRAPFLHYLAQVIAERKNDASAEKSYTKSLFDKGINKIAQKVGEEAVELVIEAKDDNKDLFLGEAADLLFHLLVLLEEKEISLDEVIGVLEERHRK